MRLYRAIFPYQVVPLFGVKKDQISVALDAVVLTGITLLGHFTDAGHTIDLPEVASFNNTSVNDAAPVTTPVVNVNVQLSVSVAVNTFPFARLSVAAVEVFPITEITSV